MRCGASISRAGGSPSTCRYVKSTEEITSRSLGLFTVPYQHRRSECTLCLKGECAQPLARQLLLYILFCGVNHYTLESTRYGACRDRVHVSEYLFCNCSFLSEIVKETLFLKIVVLCLIIIEEENCFPLLPIEIESHHTHYSQLLVLATITAPHCFTNSKRVYSR
jgi:hypothetical protein